MTPTLASLSTDDVYTDVEGLLDVFGVTDHVHDRDTGFVELIDDFFRGYADGGNEEFGFFFDDDLDEFGELAFGVVKLEEVGWFGLGVGLR